MAIAVGLVLASGCQKEERRSWVITGGRYLDVVAGSVEENGAIVVRDGEISALLVPGEPIPDDLPRVRAEGMTVLPGLWDNHVHLVEQDLNGSNSIPASAWEQYRGSPYKRNVLLEHGVTALRDPAGKSSLETRNRARRGEIESPRIFAAGSFLFAPGGYPANVVEPEILAAFAGTPADTPAEARAFVRQGLADRVDFIKIIYTSGVLLEGEYPPDAPSIGNLPDEWFEEGPILQPEVMAAAIEEAHLLGLRVAVHLDRYDEAVTAVAAGPDYIHHSWPVPETPEGEAFLAEVAAQGICWNQTLLVYASRAPELAEPRFETARRAWEAGIPITLGTDVGADGADALFGEATHREMRLLRDAGIPPIEVFRAASIVAARCLGVDETLGSIEVGKRADLTLVRGDPVADLDSLDAAAVRGVFVDGKRFKWLD